MDLIAGMFHTLLKENWTLLFLTRTVYQNALSTFMADGFDINPSLIFIPTLKESELQRLALNKGFSLPDNPRFVSRLSNLFYFGEYLKNYDDIDRKGNYRDFTDKLWIKKICGSLRKDGMDAQRDRYMIEIAKRRVDSGCFYVDTADLRQNVLFALCQDEILGFDVSRNEYFISHDIYEEWALNKIVDRSWRKNGEVPAFFSAIGDSLPLEEPSVCGCQMNLWSATATFHKSLLMHLKIPHFPNFGRMKSSWLVYFLSMRTGSFHCLTRKLRQIILQFSDELFSCSALPVLFLISFFNS